MKTKQEVLKLAKQIGVEVGFNHKEVTLIAPNGMVLEGPQVHVAVSSIWDSETMADMWNSAYADLKDGISKCGCVDCLEATR